MSEETFPESFGKIETPRRVLKKMPEPFEADHERLWQRRILPKDFLDKSQNLGYSWRIKRKGVT